MTSSLAQLLRTSRMQAGLTMHELADKMHVSESCVSRFESGSRRPSASWLPKFAKIVLRDPLGRRKLLAKLQTNAHLEIAKEAVARWDKT